MVPVLLDLFEVYKLSTKFYDCLNQSIETILTDFYFRFNPERVIMIIIFVKNILIYLKS